MNKLTLTAIATQPKYDDGNFWKGAEITAHIEAEITDGENKRLHRAVIKFETSKTFVFAIYTYGFEDSDTNIFMDRVRASLDVCTKKWPGTERDADTIYEVIRLKLPRFMNKAAHCICYSQNLRTGEINECYKGFFRCKGTLAPTNNN